MYLKYIGKPSPVKRLIKGEVPRAASVKTGDVIEVDEKGYDLLLEEEEFIWVGVSEKEYLKQHPKPKEEVAKVKEPADIVTEPGPEAVGKPEEEVIKTVGKPKKPKGM